MKKLILFCFCIITAAAQWAHAEVRLPQMFRDNMVLQRQKPIAVWGWADAGEEVAVSLGDTVVASQTDANGRWQVDLPAREANAEGQILTINGSNTITLENVLIGEVWLAGGQSNMARGVNLSEVQDDPLLRLFWVRGSMTPRRDDLGECMGWIECNQESVREMSPDGRGQFSEVAYHFGAVLRRELDVPVGIVESCYGGSQAQGWTQVDDIDKEYPFDQEVEGSYLGHRPGLLYQSMIHGMVPFAMRGVIWYQGENDGRSTHYHDDFAKLIDEWRELWVEPDWPFYFVQIAPTSYAGGRMQFIWESQQQVMETVPYTGMAVTNDMMSDTNRDGTSKIRPDETTGFPLLGGSNPHPDGKKLAAERLANIALINTYGQQERVIYGPMYDSHTIENDRVVIRLKHVGGGLVSSEGEPLNWFEISDGTREGRNLNFVPAQAEITGPDTIVVSAPGVAEPVHVRFSWHCMARHNLKNKEGLPAVSFRTYDD